MLNCIFLFFASISLIKNRQNSGYCFASSSFNFVAFVIAYYFKVWTLVSTKILYSYLRSISIANIVARHNGRNYIKWENKFPKNFEASGLCLKITLICSIFLTYKFKPWIYPSKALLSVWMFFGRYFKKKLTWLSSLIIWNDKVVKYSFSAEASSVV